MNHPFRAIGILLLVAMAAHSPAKAQDKRRFADGELWPPGAARLAPPEFEVFGHADDRGQPPPLERHRSLRVASEEERKPSNGKSEGQSKDEGGSNDTENSKDKEKSKSKDDEESLEERLKKMEKKWKKLEESDAKKKKEAASKPTVKIGGRIHADYLSFLDDSEGIHWFENPATGIDPEDAFFFRRIRLEMSGDIFENMLWRIQVDFNEPNDPQIKDVYIGFDELPCNQTLLIGHQKRPLGLDHWNSSRFNIFVERPLVVETFNQDARRPGICMLGYTDDESMFWQYGAYLLEDIQGDGRYDGDSYQASANARVGGSPWYDESSNGRGWFHWAVVGMYARPDGDVDPDDTNVNEARFRTRPEVRTLMRWYDTLPIPGAQHFYVGGVEAMLNIGAFHMTGEYLATRVDRQYPGRGTGPDVGFHGGYFQVAYFLTGESMMYERKTGQLARTEPFERFFLVERGAGWGAWQVAARVSHLDLTDQDIRGGVGNSYTLAVNWYWNAHARLQWDLTHGEIEQRFPANGYTSGHFTAMTTRVGVDF